MRAASQVVIKNPVTNSDIDNNTSHIGTPNGKRTIITTGEVSGIMENQNAIELWGS